MHITGIHDSPQNSTADILGVEVEEGITLAYLMSTTSFCKKFQPPSFSVSKVEISSNSLSAYNSLLKFVHDLALSSLLNNCTLMQNLTNNNVYIFWLTSLGSFTKNSQILLHASAPKLNTIL